MERSMPIDQNGPDGLAGAEAVPRRAHPGACGCFVVQLFTLANPLLIQVIIDKVISQRSLDTRKAGTPLLWSRFSRGVGSRRPSCSLKPPID